MSDHSLPHDNANWQQWMLNALMNPEQDHSKATTKSILPGAMLSPSLCLGIYQNGYITRLTKCLAEQFPALNTALGSKLFNQFARLFLHKYPSNSYTLYDLGKRFSVFLETERPDKNKSEKESWIDFMVELSRYEQLHFSLFDAPGHEGKVWPDENIPDEQLILQPCLALAQYQYPVAWYYHSCKQDPNCIFPPKETACVVLVRKDFFVTTYPLTPIHYQFLTRMKAGYSIPEALEYISELTQKPLETVHNSWASEVRGRWLAAGLFVEKDRAG